jgi:fucose permease
MGHIQPHWTGTAFAILLGGLALGWLLGKLSPKLGGVVALLAVVVFAFMTFAPASTIPVLQQHFTS